MSPLLQFITLVYIKKSLSYLQDGGRVYETLFGGTCVTYEFGRGMPSNCLESNKFGLVYRIDFTSV